MAERDQEEPKPSTSSSLPPGSNWDALKKSIKPNKPSKKHLQRSSFKKKPTPKPKPAASTSTQKPGAQEETEPLSASAEGSNEIIQPVTPNSTQIHTSSISNDTLTTNDTDPKGKGKESENLVVCRQLVLGQIDTSEGSKSKPGMYLALDCEMVGVGPVVQTKQGPRANESSLARVSIVNFHGVVMLDCFVKQKERVTDYRTQWSGVRKEDLIGPEARTFEEVQKNVAGLIKDRVVIGHAVRNDLKALLLSHPNNLIRDTQACPLIRKKFNTQRVALRTIIKQDLGITIQDGEHDSVIDSRAAMAIFRLYKTEWDVMLPAKAKQAISQLGDTAVPSPPPKPKRKSKPKEGKASGVQATQVDVIEVVERESRVGSR
jgi:RNA exonuclease 4